MDERIDEKDIDISIDICYFKNAKGHADIRLARIAIYGK